MIEIRIATQQDLQGFLEWNKKFDGALKKKLTPENLAFGTINLVDREIVDPETASRMERLTQMRLHEVFLASKRIDITTFSQIKKIPDGGDVFVTTRSEDNLERPVDTLVNSINYLRGLSLLMEVQGDKKAAESTQRLINDAILTGQLQREDSPRVRSKLEKFFARLRRFK